jgi:electron transport complex protein RnfE
MVREELKKGLLTENVILVSALALCPALAVTVSLKTGLCMGVCLGAVMLFTNTFVSALRTAVPDRSRLFLTLLIASSCTVIVMMLLKACLPALSDRLGIYVPLIAVNCAVIGRAENYAAKNRFRRSVIYGFGTGLGVLLVLCLVGGAREFMGAGTLAGYKILPPGACVPFWIRAPGGFCLFALLLALVNHARAAGKTSGAS